MADREELEKLRRLRELEQRSAPPKYSLLDRLSGKALNERMADEPRFRDLPMAERIAGNPQVGILYGAAKPFIGAAQLGAEAGDEIAKAMGHKPVVGDAISKGLQSFESARERGRQGGGIDVPVIAGSVGTGVAALSRVPVLSNWFARAIQGAVVGGGLGAVEPVVDTSEGFAGPKSAQMTTGAVVGAAVPLLASGVRAGYERFTEPGRQLAAGRAANQAAGARQPEIVDRLRQNQNPLSQGTAGEVAAPAGSAEFSALQRSAAQVRPSEYEAIRRGQDAARLGTIRAIGGTADDLAAQTKQVNQQVGQLYKDAFNVPLKATKEFRSVLKNTYVKDAIKDANRIAQSEGVQKGSTKYFHIVKKALDDMISRPAVEGGLGPTQQRAVMNARERFLTELERSNPLYGTARQQAAELYRPISQMKIGQYLEEKLIPALNDAGASASQRGAVLAQALRDAPGIVRRATGFKGGMDLTDYMEPEQLMSISAVVKDLARRGDYEQLAKAGSARANRIIGDLYSEQAPNALNRPIMILNAILKRTGNKASERTLDVLAEKMQNPKAMAEIMERATFAERKELENAIMSLFTQQAADASAETASRAIGAQQ